MRLAGRRALVTGADGGLGRAIGAALLDAGAEVALGVQAPDRGVAERLVADLSRDTPGAGRTPVVVYGDVRTVDGADALVDGAVAALGGLDVLVNNAGVAVASPFLDMTAAEWDLVLETNLRGYFLVGQRAARVMSAQGDGAIVNVSSTRHVQAWPGSAAYCASKGGVDMLTRTMALELVAHGIRVNSVSPGTVPTGLNAHYVHDEGFRSARLATIPAGRYGEPEEVAAAVVFLASADASFVVGADLMVDGGQTLS